MEQATSYRCTIPAVLAEQGRSVAWFCRRVGISRALFYRWIDGSRPAIERHRQRSSEVLALPQSFLFVPIESHVSAKISHAVELEVAV